jgi:hypothetical protein
LRKRYGEIPADVIISMANIKRDARSTVAQKSLRKIEIGALLLLAGSFGNGRRKRVKRLKPVAGSSIDPAAAAAAAAAGVVDKSRVAVGAGAGSSCCCL